MAGLVPVRPASTSLSSLVPVRPAGSAPTTGLLPPVAAASAAMAAGPAGFSDDDELILEIDTAQHELSDTIVAYNQRGIVYLPLGAIARFLDLAVTVSDGGRYASGWALDEKQTIALNLREGSLVIAGKSQTLAPTDALAYDGELYLRAERFGDIFPLTLTPNLRAQSVMVKTRVPFPFEQRAAREEARGRLDGRRSGSGGKHWPREATPWRALDVPLADVELRLASDTARGPRTEGDIRLGGDFAWLTARLFASGSSQDGLTSAHVELGRRSADANLLGPLKATSFGIGDVTSAPLAVGLGATAGRGLFVSNASLERASVFDTTTLSGDLPDGYEVELYRNDILIDSTRTPVNGQYQFLNVPVEFGLNVFRMVFYGPQGQRREVVRQVSVGDGRLARGELAYSVSAIQKNRAVFDIHPNDWIPGADDGSWRTSAQLQYGLTNAVTATMGGAWYERLNLQHWLATAGLRTGLGGLAVKADVAVADHRGEAFELGVAGKLAGFSMTLNHAEYRGQFVDEVRSFTDSELRRASEFTLNGTLQLGGGNNPFRIPVYGYARDIEFADGHRVQTASLRQSLPVMPTVQLANLLEFSRTVTPGVSAISQLTGSIDLSTVSRSATQYRATFDYSLLPHTRITAASVEVDRRLGEKGMVRASVGRNFTADQMQFGLSAMRRFGNLSLALDGNYSSHPGQYAVNLRLGMSFGRNPLTGRLFTAPPGLASGGAVAVRAFRDSNGDGIFGPGDEALADVGIFTGSQHATTDRNGMAFLGNLGDGPRTTVQVDADTLPDVALAPVSAGVELAPRAGRIHVKGFPIEALGEIDGTAFFEGETGAKAVSGLHLLLTDAKGNVAGRARTANDGSFWFEHIHAGHYTIALEPGQADRLNIRLLSPCPVTIGHDGTILRETLKVGPA